MILFFSPLDRISPLESHRQPLKQVCCFPGVFSDGCHSSAQLLHQLLLIIFCIAPLGRDFRGADSKVRRTPQVISSLPCKLFQTFLSLSLFLQK